MNWWEKSVFNAEKVNGVLGWRLRIHYNCIDAIKFKRTSLPTPDVS